MHHFNFKSTIWDKSYVFLKLSISSNRLFAISFHLTTSCLEVCSCAFKLATSASSCEFCSSSKCTCMIYSSAVGLSGCGSTGVSFNLQKSIVGVFENMLLDDTNSSLAAIISCSRFTSSCILAAARLCSSRSFFNRVSYWIIDSSFSVRVCWSCSMVL